MIILIPAYEPDAQLLEVIGAIHAADPALALVVVDDGSGPAYGQIFDGARRAGAHVISHHPANRGKGAALKTGFRFILDRFPGRDVVCADSDGEHSVVDILRVAELAGSDTASMVLGARTFAGDVPARSRLGNAATRLLFRLATGERISDTQTGLRGPAAMLPWLLTVSGERYEYELNLLLEAKPPVPHCQRGHRHHLSGQQLRVPLPAACGFGAHLCARCLSATANFLINRRLVFKHGAEKPAGATAARYFALALSQLTANYALLRALAGAGIADLPAKLLTEVALFAVSYAIQQRLLFAAGHKPDLVPAQPRHSLAVNRNNQPTKRHRRTP